MTHVLYVLKNVKTSHFLNTASMASASLACSNGPRYLTSSTESFSQIGIKALENLFQVKPVCPLCLKPFSSVIHNIKSNQEYEEFNIGPFWQEELLSEEEQANSYIEQHLMQAAAAYFQTESWMESSSDESSSDTSSESSWVTINTDDSDSEDNLFTLHDIFSQQLVFSDQRLGTMDALLSICSHLAVN